MLEGGGEVAVDRDAEASVLGRIGGDALVEDRAGSASVARGRAEKSGNEDDGAAGESHPMNHVILRPKAEGPEERWIPSLRSG